MKRKARLLPNNKFSNKRFKIHSDTKSFNRSRNPNKSTFLQMSFFSSTYRRKRINFPIAYYFMHQSTEFVYENSLQTCESKKDKLSCIPNLSNSTKRSFISKSAFYDIKPYLLLGGSSTWWF